MSDEINKEQEEAPKEAGGDLADEQLKEASGGAFDVFYKVDTIPGEAPDPKLEPEDLTAVSPDETRLQSKDSFGEVIPKLDRSLK